MQCTAGPVSALVSAVFVCRFYAVGAVQRGFAVQRGRCKRCAAGLRARNLGAGRLRVRLTAGPPRLRITMPVAHPRRGEIAALLGGKPDDNDEDEDMATRSETCGELFHNTFPRKSLFEAFRGFQSLFGEARERAVKAIAFAKLLRKDLEVSRILFGFQKNGQI